MHYKNGRPVELGDFVAGVSHNSGGQIVLGIVLEQMPKQGPCNIRIARIERATTDTAESQERACLTLLGAPNKWCLMTGNFDDYGDAAEFVKVEDGYKMVRAIAHHGNYNSKYST